MSFFPTVKRKWPGFCERTHKAQSVEGPQYYYRMVVGNLLNTSIDLPLDAEPIAPGETEVAAAQRLVERLCQQNRRFFDMVVADALYMEGPFVNFCVGQGKDVIIVLKDNYPRLKEDAQGLFSQMEPDVWQVHGRTVRVWDLDGFTPDTMNVPLRVLHTIETYTERLEIKGRIVEREVTQSWWWATTIPSTRLRTRDLWKTGHARWQTENNIFNTLGQHWSLNHCYKHDPVAIVNFVLVLFIVFTLVQCFYRRNLKPPIRRMIHSLIALTHQLHASVGVGSEPVLRQPPARGP